MLDYGKITLLPFAFRNAPEFFISAAQSHNLIFGVVKKGHAVWAFNLAASGSEMQTVAPMQRGSFSFLGKQGKGYFTVSEKWKIKVYHQREESKYWSNNAPTEYWREIRKEALKQDNYTCQRCGIGENLTVHHVIPRADGGGDNLENLIALCCGCHDEIEILGYRSKWQIMNQFDDDELTEDERGITNDWRAWVYGAGRRPRKK